MYPNLSYILHDLLGTPVDNITRYVQTFGLLLACAFLTAAYTLYLELRRKQALFTAEPTKNEKGQIVNVLPHERVGDITMVAAISGLLGAKIFAILESADNIRSFLKEPSSFFSGSGIAMYGGLIGGFLGVYWFITRKLKMNALHMMDAVAPGLMLAYGVGRIGCQLSGDGDWGIASGPKPSWWFLPDWMWSFDFPRNVHDVGIQIEGFVGIYQRHLPVGVYPTPFYEVIMALAIGFFLWSIRKKVEGVPGVLFMIYLILNGIERFFIEKIRVNDLLIDTPSLKMTQAEIIAVILFFTGCIGWFILNKRKTAATT